MSLETLTPEDLTRLNSGECPDCGQRAGKSLTIDEQHRQRHKELHSMLDELVADFIDKSGRLPSEASVMELMHWAYQQTLNPDEVSARHALFKTVVKSDT
jgi:hypothetical protein